MRPVAALCAGVCLLALSLGANAASGLGVTPDGLVCPPTRQYNVSGVGITGVGTGLSSNYTLVPFASKMVPVESIYPQTKKPVSEKVCDQYGRCILAYELNTVSLNLDLGFRGPEGQVLTSDLLGYDGQVPGPTIYVEQGVQGLIRVINGITCANASHAGTSNATTIPSPDYFKQGVFAGGPMGPYTQSLTLHVHGSASLSPFDGWADDLIPPCGFKDYVMPNDEQNPLWYHDHTDGWTEQTVEHGLFGGYHVEGCNKASTPQLLAALGEPVYMFLHDHVFLHMAAYPERMQPYISYNPKWAPQTPAFGYNTHIAFGDHNMVNGQIWPNVEVQRKAYRWIFLNGASYRVFNLELQDENENSLMDRALFSVVGSDGGLRQVPAVPSGALIISPGERYEVVIDFSVFAPGTVLYINNPNPEADTILPNPMFCYSHLVMKITVGGGEAGAPPVPKPFSPFWDTAPEQQTVLGNSFTSQQMEKACTKALSGEADRRIQTRGTFDTASGPYMFSEMDGSAWNASFIGQDYLGAAAKGVDKWLPTSVPVNGYETWELYNNISATAAFQGNISHPMHMHLIKFVICGRKNEVIHAGVRDYELMSAKDVVLLGPYDNVMVLARYGPNIGSYMFHCHNLGHEDAGLMAAFNVSDPFSPARTPTSYPKYAKSAERYAKNWKKQSQSPGLFEGEDPLVYKFNGTYIGMDLFFPDSMPPYAMRRDPTNSSLPQPINKELLTKVLERGYYEVFYPRRKNLSKKLKKNKWAVMCKK